MGRRIGHLFLDRGPALASEAGDLYGQGPYHTVSARVGDKVVYTAAKGAMPPKFTVIPGDPAGVDEATPLPPQQSGASLEDLIKQGYLAPSDMGALPPRQKLPALPCVASGWQLLPWRQRPYRKERGNLA